MRKEIYLFLGVAFAAYFGILDKLSSFGNKTLILILIILAIYSYNWKLKKFKKPMLAFAIFFSFIAFDFLRKITEKIGLIIYSEVPLLGFFLLFCLIYLVITDLQNHKIILEKTYFYILIFLGFVFREKIRFLERIESLMLKILPAVKYPVIIFLSSSLIILYLVYIGLYRNKKDERSFLEKYIKKLNKKEGI